MYFCINNKIKNREKTKNIFELYELSKYIIDKLYDDDEYTELLKNTDIVFGKKGLFEAVEV